MTFIAEYKIKMINSTILRVCGKENELLVQKNTNLPIIQGSSIAGALRDFASNLISDDKVNDLFGSGNEKDNIKSSRVIISDAIGDKLVNEERTQIKINSKKGIGEDKQLVKQNYLASGTKFEWKIKVFSSTQEVLNEDISLIKKCIEAIHHNYIKLGSKKTSGAGSFKIEKIELYNADLSKTNDLINYLKNNIKYNQVDNFNYNKFEYKLLNRDEFLLELETVTPILIGSDNVYNPNIPDRNHIKDGNDNFIIPGSSIKGTFRSHCEKIEKYFNIKGVTQIIFGNSEENSGKLMFSDSIFNSCKNIIYNRIKIDYFTGGVIEGGLIEEQPITGNFKLKLIWNRIEDDLINNQAIGLILLTLKDLADGSISIGSGYSIGRGRLKSKEILFNGNKILDLENKSNNIALKYVETLKIQKDEVI